MTFDKFRDYTRQDWIEFLRNCLLVILGSFFCGFGTAIFLTKLSIVNGGLGGIGIIIYTLTGENVVDIVVWAGNAFFWILGLILLGKRFATRTLLATICYPASITLFTRVPIFVDWAKQIAGDGTVANILLCAIFSGIILGVGISLTFLGGGSTGGFDVVLLLCEKYLHIRTSITSIVVDASIILVSMIVIKDNIVNSLCGILSAGLVALVIEIVYLGNQSSLQADIISEYYEQISMFVQNKLGRGATIIHAQGGYKGDERIILRVVIQKNQYKELRDFIALVDPKAFVTFTQTNAVYGEGFSKNVLSKKIKKK